jgi:hypothetical protein
VKKVEKKAQQTKAKAQTTKKKVETKASETAGKFSPLWGTAPGRGFFVSSIGWNSFSFRNLEK